MTLQRPAWLVVVFAFLLSAGEAPGQGTFQNLGFESATLVLASGGQFFDFAQAFPGWTGHVGGQQEFLTWYNNVPTSTAGFSILDRGYSGPIGVIDGNYTAFLMSGAAGVGQQADTTLAQTGLVPLGTQSLRFKAYFTAPLNYLDVTLGGETLSLIPLEAGANYTVYGADIDSWAGQTVELAFTALYPHPNTGQIPVYLDSIQFSIVGIPEPGVIGLCSLGAVLFGWRGFWRRQ